MVRANTIKPVNHAELWVEAAPAHSPQQSSRAVDERVFVARFVGDAQHSDGLVDDDDVAVQEDDRALAQGACAELRRALVDDHHRAGRNAQSRVEAALAVHRHAPLGAQVTRARPRGARLAAHDRGDRGLGWSRLACAWRGPRLSRPCSHEPSRAVRP
jgi:hypothetical protein